MSMNPSNGIKKNSVCRYFSNDGFCLFGDECQFLHASPSRITSTCNQSNASSLIEGISSNHLPHDSRIQSYLHHGKSGNNSFYGKENQQQLSSTQLASNQLSSLSLESVGNRHKSGTNNMMPNNMMPNNMMSNNMMSMNPNTPQSQPMNASNSPLQQSIRSGPSANYFVSDSIKCEIIKRINLILESPNSDLYPDLPSIEMFHELLPLESPISAPSVTFDNNVVTSVYRATNIKTGQLFCLRRLHGFNPNAASSKSFIASIEAWKKLQHSNIVSLRQVFTTKAFGDNSLIFVYDYHPGAETLMSQYFTDTTSSGLGSTAMNGYATSSRPYSQQQQHQRKLLPEALLWNFIIQLSSALRAIHANNLAYRAFDPSKIIITSGSTNSAAPPHDFPRLRLSCCGVFDVVSHETFPPTANPKVLTSHFQQEDLVSFGKVCLALACNSLSSVQRDNWQASVDLISRNYSPDLRTLICYLISYKPSSGTAHNINEIMPMIGARFYTQLESLYQRDDELFNHLEKEMDNGRILRLLTKLGTINERSEFQMDPNWSETGDRYMLKLFRDYLFHQLNEDGRPWIDLGHIISTLNKLDIGSPERLCLISRDQQNILIVSFAELKRCLDSSMNELLMYK